MTTSRRQRIQQLPDIGVLTARLFFSVQGELFARLAERGHPNVHPRHGSVLAFLDHAGTPLSELIRLSGRPKQLISRLVDELESLGYVERRVDPDDRRAKIIVPTDRGIDEIRTADKILMEIEQRQGRLLGPQRYTEFRNSLRELAGGADARPEHTQLPDPRVPDYESLEEAANRFEILELLNKAQILIDQHDAESYAGLFAPDGTFRSPFGEALGRTAIADMSQGLHASGFTEGKRHLIGPAMVEISGDAARALSYWWVAETKATPGVYSTGVYRDLLKKIDGRWLIVQREQEIDPN